jgi:hypothetical protein
MFESLHGRPVHARCIGSIEHIHQLALECRQRGDFKVLRKRRVARQPMRYLRTKSAQRAHP